MTPEEKEKFYDDEIAPAILEIAKKCHDNLIPFVAAVEWDPSRPNNGGWGKTIGGVTPSELSQPMRGIYRAALCEPMSVALTFTKGEEK